MIVRISSKVLARITLALAALSGLTMVSFAQEAIFSFEDDLQGWYSSSGVSLTRSTLGATDGTMSMLLDNVTPGYKGTAARTGDFGPTTAGFEDAFIAFNLAASVIAAGGTPKLEFDLAWDFSAATTGFIQLGLVVNSSNDNTAPVNPGGYRDYGTGNFINGNSGFASWPALGPEAVTDGVVLSMTGASSAHVSVPFSPDRVLSISDPSTFYHLMFQTQGNWTGTVDFAIDNIKFTGVPIFEEHTLFSWETPDNPGTPGVNEQLEGWVLNPQASPATPISITSVGATDGASALRIDRTGINPPDGFSWGNAFGLDATANPSDQDKIDDFVERINDASQIAIDVTFQDQFPISPSGTRLYLAFIDEAGTQYQAGSPSFDLVEASELTTQTLIFDVSDFNEYVENPEEGQYIKNLAVDGLLEGTSTFTILLGTATNQGAVYQIDNFRLISEVDAGLPGDFNDDGAVTGLDFLAWQRNPSLGNLSDWQNAYNGGNLAAMQGVPEPTSLVLLFVAGAMVIGRGRCC